MVFDETGSLTVRAYTAGGALPLKNTRVHIIGAGEENRFYEENLLTDEDGVTAKILLPAPKGSLSMSPGAPEIPYATYDMQVSAPGYYTKNIYGVAVFSGVDSIQPVAMIPLGDDAEGLYPKDNLNIYIKENERLE